MKKVLLGLSMLCTLAIGVFVFSHCQKSEEQQLSSAVAGKNSDQSPATDRGPAIDLGCTSCTDLEWKISCPQTCAGGLYDRVIVKFVAKQWDHWSNCCDNGQDVWDSYNSEPVNQWIDLSYFPVVSAMNGVCDPSFTAFFSAQAYLNDEFGNPTIRIPGKVYIQTRRKGDTTGQTLRSHEILLNQDIPSCSTVSSSDPGVQTIVPINITNGCVVTSPVEIPSHKVICDTNGGGTGG